MYVASQAKKNARTSRPACCLLANYTKQDEYYITICHLTQIPLKRLRKRSIPETDRQKNYGQASVLEPCPLNFTSYKKKTNNKSLKKTQNTSLYEGLKKAGFSQSTVKDFDLTC